MDTLTAEIARRQAQVPLADRFAPRACPSIPATATELQAQVRLVNSATDARVAEVTEAQEPPRKPVAVWIAHVRSGRKVRRRLVDQDRRWWMLRRGFRVLKGTEMEVEYGY